MQNKKNEDMDRISLRRAKKVDLMFHYNLRSEAFVRRNSFNTGVINLVGHTQWFLKKLKDSNSYLFVIKGKKKSIGQVRIDIKGNSGEISIALLPEHRGKGYAQQAIARACRISFKRNLKLKKIMAHIKIENAIAQKSFVKAGFADLQKTVYKGHPCIEMILIR